MIFVRVVINLHKVTTNLKIIIRSVYSTRTCFSHPFSTGQSIIISLVKVLVDWQCSVIVYDYSAFKKEL